VTDPTTFVGQIDATADLLFTAERVYPVTKVDFTIKTTGSVTFAAPPDSTTNVPLSAGGSITVTAPVITQGGNLFAPQGRITLGGSGTSSVTLLAGSLTSVSLGDTIVPFGETETGTNWFYNSNTAPLTTPGTKSIVLNGQDVTVGAESTIDERGGGDLQAI